MLKYKIFYGNVCYNYTQDQNANTLQEIIETKDKEKEAIKEVEKEKIKELQGQLNITQKQNQEKVFRLLISTSDYIFKKIIK